MQLDPRIIRLLSGNVTSYEQLETLLLLHGRRTETWTVGTVAEALRLDDTNVALALTALASERLLARDTEGGSIHYRYAPADPEAAAAVDLLAQAFLEQRAEVVRLMSANAIERVRSSAARAFSDAFLFRGRKDDR